MAAPIPKEKREEVRKRIYQLRLDGFSITQIADKLGYAEKTVYGAINKRINEIRDESAETVKEIRQMEIDRIDKMTLVSMKTISETSQDTDGKSQMMRDRAVNTMIKIMTRRAALFGLDATVDMSEILAESAAKVMALMKRADEIDGDPEQ